MADLDTSAGAGDDPSGHRTPPGPDAATSANAPAADVSSRGTTPAPSTRATRRRRVSKWDRPRSRRDWRWWVGGFGKILIAVGLLMFGFVAYQLYGTGIQTAAAQNRLETEFEELLADTAPVTTAPIPATTAPAPETTVVEEPETAVPVENQNLLQVQEGDALARIEIPEIGVDNIVVAGVSKGDLQKGPGHFPETPLPGQLGNSAIAGHRTTYGEPFRNVDQLEPGDEIRMTTLNGVYVYSVTGTQIVSPSDYQVVVTTDPTIANLTLTSCHPVYSASQRIVIFSELIPAKSAPVGEPVINYGRSAESGDETGDAAADVDAIPAGDDPTFDTTPTTDATTTVADDSPEATTAPVEAPADESATPGADSTDDSADDAIGAALADESPGGQPDTDDTNAGIADAFSDGWFSDPGANLQVGLWGLAVSAIAIASYLLSRRFRRDWAGLLLGIIPFMVALYFFFENVNRLLPPNL